MVTTATHSKLSPSDVSVEQFISAIERLPEDPPREREGVWYRTQKEHWLGWLSQYSGPGAYDRSGTGRDARFAYNHIVNPLMLLWIVEAAGVDEALVTKAKRVAEAGSTLMQKAGAVRKVVPWEVLAEALLVGR